MFSKINKFLLVLLLLTFSLNAFSLEDIPITDDPEESTEAPINDWIPYLLTAGTLYGAYFFEKKRKSNHLSN